jgi:hypothetical protein
VSELLSPEVVALVKKRQMQEYANGVRDGMVIVLRLVLGEPYAGANPIPEPLTDSQREWAQAALTHTQPGLKP